MGAVPYFSIVIPVYNRPAEIRKAIDSCLHQDFVDFEVVVVDDASTDETLQAVKGVADCRVRLVEMGVNRGECPARACGVENACGEWVVWVDSDHELLPGALSRLHEATTGLPREIGRVGFMCEFDDGRLSPFPIPTGEVLDYEGHVRWVERSRTSDLLMAIRRSTFAACLLPQTRVNPLLYHLDFARQFGEQWIPEVLVLQHTDSPNRLTTGYWGSEASKRCQRAQDDLKNIDQIMARHGPALERLAPRVSEGLRRDRVRAVVIVAGPSVPISMRQNPGP